MNDVRLRISPPWVTYVNKLQALFDGDSQIAFNVNWSAANPSVTISTNNPDKAAALVKLLPEEKVFGNVTMAITVECPKISNLAFATAKDLFETAFSGNPAFAYVVVPETVWYVPFTYVVFKNCVVQFFNDNLNDPHGVVSTLYEDIAEEVFSDMKFPHDGVAFCTDVERKLGVPTNEWIR
jgi:hypothetical protein